MLGGLSQLGAGIETGGAFSRGIVCETACRAWLDADGVQLLSPFGMQALERRVANVARIIIIA